MNYIIHGFYKDLRFKTDYCIDVYSHDYALYFKVQTADRPNEVITELYIPDKGNRSLHVFIENEEVSMFVASNTADEDIEKIKETLEIAGIEVKLHDSKRTVG